MGKFRGGGDEVGAALANFINAREDARARANRNEMLRQMDREEATRLQNANGGYNVEGAGGQTNWGNIFNPSNQTSADAAYAEQAPTNVMYSGRTGNGNIDYSFPARQGKEPNDYTFQNAMPTEQNGFHLGDYPQTEMYGDPKDWQRQMVRNAAGLNGDSKWFNPSVNSDNTMNIKDQGIGQNYNQRINSQIDGFYPQSPNSNVNSFGKVFQNAENTPKSNTQTIYGDQARQFNKYRQDLLKNQLQNNANPSSPAVDSPSAQATDGNNINSVGTTKAYYGKDPNVSDYDTRVRDLANAKYLDKQYLDYDQWSRFVNDNGVTNGSLRHVLYEDRVQPLIEQARQERLRESYRIANDPNVDENTRTQALAALAYDLKKPTLVNDVAWAEERRQMEREGNALRNQNILSQINHRNFQDLGDYAGVNLEGKSWVRNNDGVDLSNAQPHTIAGLNHISDIFQQMTGKQLIVTSGNDGNIHAGGEFSHGNGWKVDVSGNGLEDPNIRHQFIQQCENLGIRVFDEYEHPSANSTGGHLDLQFSGYRGNVTGRRGNGSRYTNSRNSVNTNGRNTDMTDKEYSGITSAIDALNSEGTPENGGKLANALLNEYSRTLNSSGSVEVAADSLYKILLDGNKYGKLNLPKEQVAAIVADAVSTKHRNKGMAMQIKNMLLGKGGSSQTPTPQQPANQGDKTLDTINGYGTNVDDVKGGKYSFGNITIDERLKDALDKAGNAYKDKVNSLRPGDEIDRWGNVITKEQKQAEAVSRLKDVLGGLFSSDEEEQYGYGLD